MRSILIKRQKLQQRGIWTYMSYLFNLSNFNVSFFNLKYRDTDIDLSAFKHFSEIDHPLLQI